MLTNGNWTYTWNGENRLIKAENSSTGIKVEFDYDYMGRRIFKKVYSGETLEKHLSFVYDGYKLIEERNALANNAAVRNYVWQPEALDRDVPLTVYDVASEKTYYYHTDANKNVTELSDENGGIVAHYEYSPFGSLTKVSGDYADRNPFRFSSEYFDEETGLIYYNYRYYNPELGRWISRDPIEEQGGYNLYGMIGNNPLYGWDMLGYELCSRCSNLTWSQKLALYLQTKVNNLADDLAGGNYYANVGIYWGAELANGALGEDIIGLAKFSDSGFFDGYCFIEKSDISRVRHGGNEQDAIFALIERKKQLSFMKKDFHFQSMRDVIEQFKTEIITIFIEKIDSNICFLGTVVGYDSENILLQALGTFSSRDSSELILRWKDITRIEVESLYLQDIKAILSRTKE